MGAVKKSKRRRPDDLKVGLQRGVCLDWTIQES